MDVAVEMERPGLRKRLLRRLGWRYHLGVEPDDVEGLRGWMRSRIRLDLTIADRLRLLLTGRLEIVLITHTDTRCPEIIRHRTDWMIHGPGEGAPIRSATSTEATSTGPVADRWTARWYGSDPWHGASIWTCDADGIRHKDAIAHLGPDHLETARILAEAHNAAIRTLESRGAIHG